MSIIDIEGTGGGTGSMHDRLAGEGIHNLRTEHQIADAIGADDIIAHINGQLRIPQFGHIRASCEDMLHGEMDAIQRVGHGMQRAVLGFGIAVIEGAPRVIDEAAVDRRSDALETGTETSLQE